VASGATSPPSWGTRSQGGKGRNSLAHRYTRRGAYRTCGPADSSGTLTPGLGTRAIPTASKQLIGRLHPSLCSGPLVIPGATSCLGSY
jgi:hypothetical protein